MVDMDDRKVYLLVIMTSIALYGNSIFCGFVFDDLPAIKNNKDLDAESPWSNLIFNDFWGTPMAKERSHKSYRPLTVFTFKLNNLIFGREPWSYHAFNIILNTTVCILYFNLCLKICEECSKHSHTTPKRNQGKKEPKSHPSDNDNWRMVAYMATAFFVTHPIHCEAVTGVVGRAELLSALFILLSLLSYMKSTMSSVLLSALFCICAVASKEQGITVVAICAVIDLFILYKLTPLELIFFRKTSNIYTGLRIAVMSLTACVAMLWRFSIMGGNIPSFTNFDNPASFSSTPTRQMTFNFLLTQNSWLLLNPGNLLCDWTMGTVPLITEISDPRNMATFAFWLVTLGISFVAAYKKTFDAKVALIALALVVFPFLPASNLFFSVGFVIAERILYVPSMGFCLLVSLGLGKIMKYDRFKNVAFWIFGIVLLSFSTKTVLRNFEWESDYTLFQSGLRLTKSNAKIWNNVGHSLEDDHPRVALLYFNEASRVQPNDLGSHMNVGRVKKRLEMYSEAEASYRIAKSLLPRKRKRKELTAPRIPPDHLQLFVHLGNLLKMNKSRLNEADELYKEAIRMREDFTEAYLNRGEILIMLGKFDEAIKCYKDALLYSDRKDDVYFNLGVVHSQIGNISGAVEYYTYAIQENQNHIKALYNSAVIFEETGNEDLVRRARIRVERVLKLEPDNYLALSLLGSIHLDNGDEAGALSYWEKVLKVHPDDKSALFNMALMYSKKPNGVDDCIRVVETLLSFHPNYTKGLMLYGDVLLNHRKDTKAAGEAFKRIIEADPKDIRARHNYCVVVLEEGRLTDAEKCMHDVLLMAPEAKYVSDNLAIIRRHIVKAKEQKIDSDIGFVKSQSKEDEVKAKETSPQRDVPPPAEEEELVFVEPVRKKTRTEKAKLILEEAKKAARRAGTNTGKTQLADLENALKNVHSAHEKLKAIKKDVSRDYEKKCPKEAKKPSIEKSKTGKRKPSKETENLRKQALDILNQLEAGLE